MIITDNYPPCGTPLRPVSPTLTLLLSGSPARVKWLCLGNKLWVAVIQSEIWPCQSNEKYINLLPSSTASRLKETLSFLTKEIYKSGRQGAARNCSVESFFSWGIILSRWQICLTKRGQCCSFENKHPMERLLVEEQGKIGCLNQRVGEWVNGWLSEAESR